MLMSIAEQKLNLKTSGESQNETRDTFSCPWHQARCEYPLAYIASSYHQYFFITTEHQNG